MVLKAASLNPGSLPPGGPPNVHVSQGSGVVRPSWGWFAALDGGIVALVALSASERAYVTVKASSPGPFPSRGALRALLAGTAVIHLVEAAAAGRNARRRGLATRGWAFQTLLVGFPSLLALRRVPMPVEPGS
jgi:Domain of unknown function (DUF4499)